MKRKEKLWQKARATQPYPSTAHVQAFPKFLARSDIVELLGFSAIAELLIETRLYTNEQSVTKSISSCLSAVILLSFNVPN
jgi:hypothetical protein